MKHRFVDGMIGGIIVLVLALLIFSLTGSVEAWSRNNQIVGGPDNSGSRAILPEGQPTQLQGEIQEVTDTSISYQGQLKVNNLPYNGSCEIYFNLYTKDGWYRLYDTVTKVVPVTNGLFTAVVDVENDFAQNFVKKIEPLVRCPTGSGSFVSLGKQYVTAVPYALNLVPGASILDDNEEITFGAINWSPADGIAIHGFSENGAGIYGSSSDGSGVVANNRSSGPALEIDQGSIKIDGAGVGSNTPVFIHQVPASNPCSSGYMTRIDNTLIDNQPGAILLVTYHDTGVDPVRNPIGVAYDSSGGFCGVPGHWLIYDLSASPVSFTTGQQFNVLAVLP